MGTKNCPGDFDCYANAKDDEPMFVLLARDRVGADTVRMWVALRVLLADPDEDGMKAELDGIAATILDASDEELRDLLSAADVRQVREALACADAMEAWRLANLAHEGND